MLERCSRTSVIDGQAPRSSEPNVKTKELSPEDEDGKESVTLEPAIPLHGACHFRCIYARGAEVKTFAELIAAGSRQHLGQDQRS